MTVAVSVVVPAKNAAGLLSDCLASIVREQPAEVIVVDGDSTDGTVDIARRYGAKVVSDGGDGLPVARMLGAREARSATVMVVDADVVLPPGSLAALLEELSSGGYDALQAGLHSVSTTDDYWGEALAEHHRNGRSKNWFGLVATLFRKDAFLSHGLDERFASGEDIEFRTRLSEAGTKIAVSSRVVVEHRFPPGFDFAKRQWLADGAGLGRMIRARGLRALPLFGMPIAGAVLGIGRGVLRGSVRWVPYYLAYAFFNYVAMLSQLFQSGGTAESAMRRTSTAVAAGRIGSMAFGFFFWLGAARLVAPRAVGIAATVVAAMMLCTQFALAGLGAAFIERLPRHRQRPGELLNAAIASVSVVALVVACVFLGVAALVFDQLGPVIASPLFVAVFIGTTLLATLNMLLDEAAIAFDNGRAVLARNVTFGATTLAALVTSAAVGHEMRSLSLFSFWFVGALVAFGVGLRQLRRAVPGYAFRPRLPRGVAKELMTSGSRNHLLTLAERLPAFLLPVVVAETLSPTANAYWYTSWMIAYACVMFPVAFGLGLFSHAARDPARVRSAVITGIRGSLALGGPAALLLALAAPLVLTMLGTDYADAASTPLRILLAAVLPAAVVHSYYGVCRAQGRHREATAAAALAGVGAVVAALLVAGRWGLVGVATTWLVAMTALGAWATLRLAQLRRAGWVTPSRHRVEAAASAG